MQKFIDLLLNIYYQKEKYIYGTRKIIYSNQYTHHVIWMIRYWDSIVINKFILDEFNKEK